MLSDAGFTSSCPVNNETDAEIFQGRVHTNSLEYVEDV